MTLLQRYVLRYVLVSSVIVFALFGFVLFYGNATRHDEYFLKALFLSADSFFLLSGLLIPYVLSYAVPLGFMAGILLSLGRMSADREIVAMKACGLSLTRIAAPVFLLALLATGLCLLVNLQWAPQANAAFEQNKERLFFQNLDEFLSAEKQLEFVAAEQNFPKGEEGDPTATELNPAESFANLPHETAFNGLQAKRDREALETTGPSHENEVSRYVLSVDSGENGVWRNLRVWFMNAESEPLALLSAESGTIRFDEAEGVLWLSLKTANYQQFDGSSFLAFRDHDPIPLQLKGGVRSRSLKHKTIRELLDHRKELKAKGEDSFQADFHIHKSCALAFAPLSLGFLAVPLAIRVGRRETMFNAGLALSLALVYFFFLTIVPEWLENVPQARPDLLVWAPNILFQGIGLALFRSLE